VAENFCQSDTINIAYRDKLLGIYQHTKHGIARTEEKATASSLAATTALCFLDLGIYQLDDRHRSGIAGAVSEAQNPGVTTLSFSKPWGDFIEQLLHDSIALYHLECLTACMQVPALA
jgi:hypothetical protein